MELATLAPARGRARVRPVRRPVTIVGYVVLGLGLAAITWLVVTALLARARLESVRVELPALRRAIMSGNVAQSRLLAERITHQADSAHTLTTGPAWWIAAQLPIVGSPARTTRAITEQIDRIGGDTLPGVVRLADSLQSSLTTRSTINLGDITKAVPQLRLAAATMDSALRQISSAPGSWLPPVASARHALLDKLGPLAGDLDGANRAIRIALPMLGAATPQRYFIGVMNEAESRGLGGIPGAFAIATVDHGHLSFDHFGSDDDLRGVRAKVDLGADFNARYRLSDPTRVIQNSDVSPDFRYAAQIWAGMWEHKSGQHVDGAIAVDPTALSYLLKVSGPVTMADGTTVTAANVVALTQQKQYALFPSYTSASNARRKLYLESVARAIAAHVVPTHSIHGFLAASSRAAQERRLVVWSADPALEHRIIMAGWAGAVTAPSGTPVSGFVVTNASGGKLDYYLHRSMTYTRTGCDSSGRTHVTFALHNAAPRTGLPPYVTTREDDAPAGARPGDEKLIVTYYATPGAQINNVSVDAQPIIVATQSERGLVTASLTVELPAGATRTVALTVVGPAATADAMILRQPGVHPIAVQVDQPRCASLIRPAPDAPR